MSSLDLLEEACAGLPYTKRAMFGGHGLFAPNGGMFAAVVDEDRLALKLPEEATFAEFLAEGARPWVYDGRTTMRKWAVVPEEMYDEPARLAAWARRAHATAEPKRAKTGTQKAPGKAPAKKAKGAKR